MKAQKIQKKKYKIKEKGGQGFNHEIMGLLVTALGILILLSFYFKNSIGLFGTFIRELLLGLAGMPAFVVPPVLIVYGIMLIFKKNNKVFTLRVVYATLLLVLISSMIQTGYYPHKNYHNYTMSHYLAEFYKDGKSMTGGGILGGLVSMPFLLAFGTLGTLILLTTSCLIDIILLTNMSVANFIRNIKSSFVSFYNNRVREKDREMGEEADVFEPEKDDFSGAPEPVLKAGPKIIDFKIEKSTRERKDSGIPDKKAKAQMDDPLEEELGEGPDPDEFVIKDIKIQDIKKKVKAVSSTEAAGSRNIQVINRQPGQYSFPPADILSEGDTGGNDAKSFKAAALEGARKLEETLASFGVAAKVLNVSRGPTVTRYELQPSAGVKVSRIVNLSDDISLNLASSGVRIEAPIPGKAAIGIEVPNKEVTMVSLREVIESPEFTDHPSKLSVALGKDITGDCIVADIARMPHLLVAGATGSGKSVCINCLIVSLIYKASPDEVKFLMVDPKVVELGVYNGIPHLLIPVVTDPKKAAGALNWAVQEMVNRYKLFADRSVRDIKGYNELLRKNGEQGVLPHIVIIIDELADLMMVAPNDVEDAICRLAQMARAAGMHLVIATQRPSVDVITGVIKANIPSRISFAVSSQVDSRTILDMAGAEKLLGKGDMLFYPVGRSKPVRVQGAFVSDKEVEDVVEHVKMQGNAEYNNDIIEEINTESEPVETSSGDNDELLPRAIELVVDAGQASVSLIQRKFKVGYARAARIIDQMEERGIVGGFEGSKPRQILITKQQWQELQLADDK